MTKEDLQELEMLWCNWVQRAVDNGPNSDMAVEASNKFIDHKYSPSDVFNELERLQELLDKQTDYSISLQRIIERIETGNNLDECKLQAPHHYSIGLELHNKIERLQKIEDAAKEWKKIQDGEIRVKNFEIIDLDLVPLGDCILMIDMIMQGKGPT